MLPVQFRIDSFFYRDRFKIFFPHLLEKFFVFIHQLLTQKTGKQMCLLLFKANFDRFFQIIIISVFTAHVVDQPFLVTETVVQIRKYKR